ncbi:MAG: hypothetical protein H7Z42_12370 [Roseiflexaceae bacterium]|nr:hypothetical protein [Roseiflexaceae bacterium]
MIHEATVEPARSLPLTGWLVFVLLANVWTVYRYGMIIYDLVDHMVFDGVAQWALPLLATLSVVNVAAVVLLWFWRKVGLYMFVATSVIALVVNSILQVPLTSMLLGLVGLIILWFLLRPHWSNFR